ncbi:carboxy-terminal domain RNA polymerase II polypeptide A small phosphatase 1 [Ricinus communis]|uniref:Carboxy-terminal domain RNA polymerase II polypeptide A small phosphatase, putative n=1 Tax=Ricinus communis TaxID=3988 RepID=B9S8F4_RICCO|nr:carboxy-terminal domain RNA polymerase II polypeptide A small phosphatase 1 [Ricinus communis]EEF40131.1 Carboxy-terminal domain RNA polymerase II polypeptide A small phosphatase, putative [Ricinus communis]|eukprot:XP_002522273.1 carboxy-terminal domain RNA polymerase II polypeptide A small phosphatase 1 [Ricinus communis]
MVSKALKKTPTKSIKDRRGCHRRQKKKSPAKTHCIGASSNAIFASINKTIYSCKRRLAKIFSKLARISTPNSRYKGYKILKNGVKDRKREQEPDVEKDGICRVLFFNEKLPPLISPNKRTVFLDLDETLVHSKADPPPHVFDFVVRPNIDGEFMNFYVLKRPGVDEFLEALAAKYEVVVFTAGLKAYASLVLDRLDEKGLISHRLYRDSCREVDGKFVKDLSEMGRDLKRVVIVDDNPNCYTFQPDNAIPIKPFIDDLRDGELGKLAKFFNGCDGVEDMRNAVKQFVCGEGDNKKVNVQV